MLEVLVGFGIAGTGFGVILAVVGRAASDENRSMALAIATAAGSAGQVFGAPLAEYLLSFMTWQNVFVVFAAAILATLALLPLMKTETIASKSELEESMGQILIKAFKDPSYTLIFLGFFSCGYQLAFITAHFPAFVTEMCGAIDPSGTLAAVGVSTTSALGAISISLIGLANIAGTLFAGYLGKTYSKKYLLATIYAGRTIVAGLVHPDADHADLGHYLLDRDGIAVAGDRAADLGSCRAYLWAALHGDALWDRLLLAPVGQLFGRLAGRPDV